MNILCFDIETIPDTDLGRRIYDLGDLDDESVAKVMRFKQLQARQTDFLPLPQHRIVVISVLLRNSDGLRIFSLDEESDGEREVVRRFFDGLERYCPDLVSWNGSGFDLPVLQYRALKHGVTASRYWEIGDTDRDFRYNNYLSRFHWRHIDLMDVLAGFQIGGRASLEHTAQLLGLPGKLGMSGAHVWDYYRQGRQAEIVRYCETDVLNTYLVYLRFELMRGNLDRARYDQEIQRVRDKIERSEEPHWQEFSAAWSADGDSD
jgi:predicted PolB exonuclease-like 3'-5' exonuclease